MASLTGYASAANTVDNYTGTAAGNVTTGTNWSLNAVPGITNDAVFPVGSATGIRNFGSGATAGPSLVVGSLDDLATSGTVTIQNITTAASAVTITLGGAGNLGNSVSGNAADLFYVASGGTFNITGTGGTGATLGLVLGQNSGNFDIAGTSTISAPISDGGSGFGFNKIGAGTLTLSGANTYTGTTGISGGTVTLSGSLAATSFLSMNAGTLAYTKATSTQNLASTAITTGANFITTVTGSTVGLGTLTETAGATVDLTAAGTGAFTTSNTTNTGGILAGWATYGGTTFAVAPASSGGAVTGLSTFETTAAGGNTQGNYTNTNVDVTTSPTLGGTATVNSVRFNTGALTLTLATGTNTITSGGILVGSGATSGTITGGTITSGGNSLYLTGSKGLTINSIIAGAGVSLVDSNSGGLTLSAANTYTGNTYINAGNVTFSSGTTPFGSGGTIFLGANGNTSTTALISSNLSNTFSNPITVEPGGRREIYTTVGGSPTYSGAITLVGGATLEAGPNANTNMTFTGGATGTGNIIFGAPQAGRTANIIVSGSNPINLTGTISDLDTLSGQNNTGTVTVSAPIQGATAVLQNSTTAQFILSGTNTYTGSTNITAGTLEFAKAASTGSSPISVGSAGTLAFNVDGNGGISNGTSGAGTMGGLFAGLSGTAGSTIAYTAGSTLALDTTNATGGTYSYAGDIPSIPATNLTKIGTGTLVLSGANSYSGATKISSGILQFANPGAMSGSSAITVAAGTTLGVNAGGSGEFTNGASGNGTIGGLFAGVGGQSGSTITYAQGTTATTGSYVGIDTTNAGGSLTYAGNITNAGVGVNKLGTGNFVLSGANTYTGPTLVTSGGLLAGVAAVYSNGTQVSGAFGLNSAVITANTAGAVLNLNGFDTQIGSLAGGGSTGGTVSLGANMLTEGGDNTSTTYAGVISGTGGSLTKIGTGTLNLTATSTFTGGTTITGGTVFLSSTGGLSSSVAVGAGAFLSIARPASESGTIGASSIISGAGGVVQNINNPNQAFTLDRPNTYTGPTQGPIRGGFIAGVASTVDGSGNQLTGAFGVNSQIQFTSGSAVLALNGYANQVGSLVSNGAGVGEIVLGGLNAGRPASVLTIGGDNAATANYQGVIAESSNQNSSFGTAGTFGGSIVKIGTGNQTFSGNNLYAGATTIKGGTLTVTTLANGGVATTASAASSASTTLNVSSTAGLVVGQSLEATGVAIGTPPTIATIGTNSITLSAAQTIANNTPLYFGNGNGLGIATNAAANLVLDGGTLAYTGAAASTDRLFTVGSTEAGGATGTLDASGTGALNFTNTGAVAYGTVDQSRTLGLAGTSAAANTLSPVIGNNGAGAVAVTKSGVGTWTLASSNSYSGGTTVNAGTLTSTVVGGFGTGNVTVNPTGIAGTTADAATLNSLGSIASTANVTVNSNSGTAIGTLNFNGTTPAIGSLAGTGSVVLNNAGGTTLTINGSGGTANSSFSGVISQGTAAGSLVSTTPGVVTLSGPNTYTGGTTVNAGTLLINNATGSGTGTGAVVVGNGISLNGTLGGAGTIGGAVTVNAGSTLAPGAAATPGTVGMLTVGALTLAPGSTLAFDITSTSSKDLIQLTPNGVLTLGGTLALNLPNTSSTGIDYSMPYIIASGVTGVTGAFSSVTGYDSTDYSANFSLDGMNNYDLSFTAVPEPSTWVGGVFLLGAMAWQYRRQGRRMVS